MVPYHVSLRSIVLMVPTLSVHEHVVSRVAIAFSKRFGSGSES
jgi:hypothetical protein